jgi:hypothetical protein
LWKSELDREFSACYDGVVSHAAHTYIKPIEFDVGEFFCHFYHPAKMPSAISQQNEDARCHVPLARSCAQIKNFDLALQWTPSQKVPDRLNVVATQKFFK